MRPAIWRLSFRHALAHPLRTGIIALCIGLSVFLPLTVQTLMARYRHTLTARATSTPLVAGSKGNRFDLTLTALYFRRGGVSTIPLRASEELTSDSLCVPIPLNARFTAQDVPIVAIATEYFAFRGLTPSSGTLPLRLGDCVLGSSVARRLSLAQGDHLYSDQREVYDISKPPALKMRITGVLAPSGLPDDEVIFTDLKTAWVLEGAAHGHDDPKTIDRATLLAQTESHISISGALIEYNEITPQNAASFHIHGDREALPLSAIIVLPRDEKAATILRARFNASPAWQMVVPSQVIDDLLSYVFRIKSFLDAIAILMGATTGLLIALVILLSMRLRAREMLTLNRLGCRRFTVLGMLVTEMVMIMSVGAVIGLAASAGAIALAPNLIQSL
ncbi:MAG: hypothetical protein H6811_04295 [Phycisphaeraceae bacterium]|nr:hypothetical protein [Phycisphaeraceae bacterium]